MLYFAYGSNMPRAMIEQRVGPCERVGVAYITGYALRFHKESVIDYSGKCDAYRTGDPNDSVWGAIYRLTGDQIFRMDELEGPGYRRAAVRTMLGGRVVEADLYLAEPEYVKPDLPPFDSYKACVLAGGRELGLPKEYVDAIEAVPSMPDPGQGDRVNETSRRTSRSTSNAR